HERQYAYEDRRSACRQLFEIHQPLQMPDAIGQGSVAMDGEIPVGTGIDAHRVYADAGDPALLDQPERRLASHAGEAQPALAVHGDVAPGIAIALTPAGMNQYGGTSGNSPMGCFAALDIGDRQGVIRILRRGGLDI